MAFQANYFIEKVLPMYVHHQIIEGLSVTAGDMLKDLETYEAVKFKEVF